MVHYKYSCIKILHSLHDIILGKNIICVSNKCFRTIFAKKMLCLIILYGSYSKTTGSCPKDRFSRSNNVISRSVCTTLTVLKDFVSSISVYLFLVYFWKYLPEQSATSHALWLSDQYHQRAVGFLISRRYIVITASLFVYISHLLIDSSRAYMGITLSPLPQYQG